jgi:type IV pilus assembly protein PilY1
MHTRLWLSGSCLAIALLASAGADAQNTYSENFTGATTVNSWYFLGGACLTAGSTPYSTPSTTTPGQIPLCYASSSSRDAYYSGLGDNTQGATNAGGGYAGKLPDPVGKGALRFTDNFTQEHGGILSGFNFQTSQGIQVTFTTETYEGNSYNSGGSNATKDGADGISFYLQSVDEGEAPGVGATGGSLGYTCSNTNAVNDGVIGGYIGLGIDEFGNFLNPGDNTNSGPGFQGNRIGLRGRGSTAWAYLTATYPTYYPSSLTPAQQVVAVRNTCNSELVAQRPGKRAVDLQYLPTPQLPSHHPESKSGRVQHRVLIHGRGRLTDAGAPVQLSRHRQCKFGAARRDNHRE